MFEKIFSANRFRKTFFRSYLIINAEGILVILTSVMWSRLKMERYRKFLPT